MKKTKADSVIKLSQFEPQIAQIQASAKDEVKDWAYLVFHAIAAPVIVWPRQEDGFTDMKNKVVLHRLGKLLKHDYSERATDFEVALYCSSASLERKPGEEEFHIYMYAARHSGLGAVMDQDDMLKDDGLELDPYTEKPLYDNLARWIYKKQKEHLKDARKAAPKGIPDVVGSLDGFMPTKG
jgi:hypothetical protein